MSARVSKMTGRFAGERVVWEIPDGHPVYEAGRGAGAVTVPNDGGFVWIDTGDIVPAEFCRAEADERRDNHYGYCTLPPLHHGPCGPEPTAEADTP